MLTEEKIVEIKNYRYCHDCHKKIIDLLKLGALFSAICIHNPLEDIFVELDTSGEVTRCSICGKKSKIGLWRIDRRDKMT